jgi:hypothetical protein
VGAGELKHAMAGTTDRRTLVQAKAVRSRDYVLWTCYWAEYHQLSSNPLYPQILQQDGLFFLQLNIQPTAEYVLKGEFGAEMINW